MSGSGWNSVTLENEVVYSEGYITRVGATKNSAENQSKTILLKQIM